MNGSFGPPDCFPGDRNGYHRHSQSSSNHMGLDFSSMMLPAGQPSGPDVSRLPNGGGAYESHDDLCIDQCMGVGLYNGSQYFNHRGTPASQPNCWASRVMPPHQNPGSLYDYSLNLDANAMQFRTGFAPSHSDLYQHWYNPQPQTDLDQSLESLQGREEDSESCCNSECTMTGKCSNTACANKEDACTDQTCPERPVTAAVPSEVVDGAAALISINHAPGQQPQHGFTMQPPVMSDFDFGLSSSSQQPYLWSPTVGIMASHLLAAHGDPDSSTCTRPCVLDDPHNFLNCPIPLFNPTSFDSQYDSVDSSMQQVNQDFVECGAEVPDSDAFLAHFNSRHRPMLTANTHNSPLALAMVQGGEDAIPSIEGMSSSSPATPLDTPDFSASSNTPSPLTPMSHSMDMSETKRSATSPDRSMSVVSGENHVHKCLWREEGSTTICGHIYSSPEELFTHAADTHIKNAKKGDNGFRCGWDDCPRSAAGALGFPQRSKIERHMQTHIDHKPHVCPTCHKGFSAKQALNQHMFIHTNQKPLECNICGKAFRYPSALTMHQRVHSGIKPLSCPVCGKSFSESSNLSKHKRTHEVRGRFRCRVPGCDRNFHRQDQLRRHMKTHEKEGESGQGEQVDFLTTKFESVFERHSEE
ncbi:hypothetical protein B0T25DRAFT_444505 [Lasiosphaeria hispida]|uniref:C2H2-type domain-containing protein n=1 Tax=Lasiosphaeria hispida TaxID=260671 RepID=A0AAJ0MJM1_9PEZI|nr:hypothetical protein B0T25DRAFT_444505 [Lasiosphaeria hispida]